jgi:two-component system, NarL family, nitrate/nitrite response regulator NarL
VVALCNVATHHAVRHRRNRAATRAATTAGNAVAPAASTIAREHPGVRIVILTASDCYSDVAVRAVQRVYAGEFYVTPSLAARLLTEMSTPAQKGDDGSEELSSREEIILAQVSKGLTNKEIAKALNLREKTVTT